jgi:tRNA threonylcarbamoyladenosine biosynthesis protein TsaE
MELVTGPTGPLPSAPLELVTDSVDETRQVARAMSPVCVPGDVLLLAGDLGAGKTAFAQGFGAGLGITEAITSPTFTLVRQYPVTGLGAGGVRTMVHADMYRLEHLHEIVDLGLPELVEEGGVALVEWGEAAEPVLGEGSLPVRMAMDGTHDQRRTITLGSAGGSWPARWDALRAALARWLVDR